MTKKGSLKQVVAGTIKEIEGVKLPEPIPTYLTKYSKQSGEPVGSLIDRIVSLYKEDVANHKRRSDLNHWTKALNKLRVEMRKEDGSITAYGSAFTAFICADTGALDFVELMKRKAVGIYNRDPKRAQDMELTDASGNPLDTRKQVNFQDNLNYMMPFNSDDHAWARTLYGFAKYTAEDAWKFFQLNIQKEDLEDIIRDPNMPFQQFVQFKANDKSANPTFELNAGKGFKFVTTDEDVNLDDVVENSGMEVYGLTDLETVKEMVDNRQVVLVKALVYSINPEVNEKTGNRTIILDDMDMSMGDKGIPVFMPEHIPLDFSEATEVTFFVTIGDNKGKIILNGLGYYVSPDMKD